MRALPLACCDINDAVGTHSCELPQFSPWNAIDKSTAISRQVPTYLRSTIEDHVRLDRLAAARSRKSIFDLSTGGGVAFALSVLDSAACRLALCGVVASASLLASSGADFRFLNNGSDGAAGAGFGALTCTPC